MCAVVGDTMIHSASACNLFAQIGHKRHAIYTALVKHAKQPRAHAREKRPLRKVASKRVGVQLLSVTYEVEEPVSVAGGCVPVTRRSDANTVTSIRKAYRCQLLCGLQQAAPKDNSVARKVGMESHVQQSPPQCCHNTQQEQVGIAGPGDGVYQAQCREASVCNAVIADFSF